MKVFIHPQINNAQAIRYLFMGDSMKVSFYQLIEYQQAIEAEEEKGESTSDIPQFETIKEQELIETVYFDLSNIEEEKKYQATHPIVNAMRVDGELKIQLIHYVTENATEEETTPMWVEPVDVSPEDFGEGDSVQLTELEKPAEEVDPLSQMQAENAALELRVESLRQQIEEDRRISEATTLELLELMMSLI